MRLTVAVLVALAIQSGALLPAGTIVHARLSTSISSQTSRAGDPVLATLIAPVIAGNGEVPYHAVIRGRVVEAYPHTFDRAAQLRLAFTELELNGTVTPINATVTAVDNARESVNADGTIQGPATQADTTRGRLELLALAVLVPEAFVLDVGGSRIREGANVDVSFQAGTDFDLRLTAPVTLATGLIRSMPTPPAISPSLLEAIKSAPTRTAAGTPSRPADVINVMFVGSQAALAASFERAGWSTADQLSMRADALAVLAIAAQEGYRQAPVSLATLDGRPPEAVYQKQTNTFAKRHHVRIWRRGSSDGQAVWLGAATHDVGVEFDTADRSFSHRIERAIDLEREKVVNDLRYAGVASAVYVERPSVPRSMENAERDPMSTDGRLAVLRLP